MEKRKKWRNKVKKMEKADKNEKIFLRNKKEIDNFIKMKSRNKKYGEKAGKQKFFWKKTTDISLKDKRFCLLKDGVISFEDKRIVSNCETIKRKNRLFQSNENVLTFLPKHCTMRLMHFIDDVGENFRNVRFTSKQQKIRIREIFSMRMKLWRAIFYG